MWVLMSVCQEVVGSHPYVLGVQAVLTPGRGDAVVEVGARAAHVQLLLVGLRGDVLPGLGPLG